MEATELLISASNKTRELISSHKKLKDDVAVLRKQLEMNSGEILHLKEQCEILTGENRNLKEQIKTIKLAQSLTNGSGDQGSRQVKMKINEYIREIDKCLSLLNRE